MRRGFHLCAAMLALWLALSSPLQAIGQEASAPSSGSMVETDSLVILRHQPAPHDGSGATTAYPFFAEAPGLEFVFRKRALHPGASIGYHRHEGDEIYYVLSGTGELTLDGTPSIVGPGTAILTRKGSSHGLKQVGEEDLVILIVYRKAP